MAKKTEKKLYKIDTYDHGVYYRYAVNPVAAKYLIVRHIFGNGYEGWEHDFWTVTEEPPRQKAG